MRTNSLLGIQFSRAMLSMGDLLIDHREYHLSEEEVRLKWRSYIFTRNSHPFATRLDQLHGPNVEVSSPIIDAHVRQSHYLNARTPTRSVRPSL